MLIPQITLAINVEENEDRPKTDYQRWLEEQGKEYYASSLLPYHYNDEIVPEDPRSERFRWFGGGTPSLIAILLLFILILHHRGRRQALYKKKVPLTLDIGDKGNKRSLQDMV